MPDRPIWLPEMLNMKQSWEELLKILYRIFYVDFVVNIPSFNGKVIFWDERILEGAYPEGFWHLITRDEVNHGRVPDFRRAERLPWCAPTILNNADPRVCVWDFRESSGVIRTYLWLVDWDYVLVLQKPSVQNMHKVKLITAFHVDGESRRRNLKAKYSDRIQ